MEAPAVEPRDVEPRDVEPRDVETPVSASRAPVGRTARDERAHSDAAVEEWWFSCWATDGSFGLLTGWRLVGPIGWHWAVFARRGRPLVHMTEWAVPRRADPMLAKAPEMWAEIECVAPFDQWTIGNEMYAAALEEPADALSPDALGFARGHVMPFAMDLEWYATEAAENLAGSPDDEGYCQRGVVHGSIELLEGGIDIAEVPAARWHRWGARLGDPAIGTAGAHLGLRAPVSFPDGSVMDLVLTVGGWRRRAAMGDGRHGPGGE
jgi:hypothetical protein